MDPISINVIDLTNGDYQPVYYCAKAEQLGGLEENLNRLIGHMLKTEGGIFVAEIFIPDDVEDPDLYGWYLKIATVQGHGGRLRVINDDQEARLFRFFIYRMPMDAPGDTLIQFPQEAQL